MAQIKPFQAVRPTEEFADRVAALPYDVYNREEATKEVQREPLSFRLCPMMCMIGQRRKKWYRRIPDPF